MMIQPYENDAQSLQIGDLTIENQTDKVIIYGDIDIYKSLSGLDQAKQLQTVINAIVNSLQQAEQNGDLTMDSLAENTNKASTTAKQISNPFS